MKNFGELCVAGNVPLQKVMPQGKKQLMTGTSGKEKQNETEN